MPTYPARPAVLRDVRHFVRGRAVQAGFPPEKAEELVGAVSEACANAVHHSGSPEVRVTWTDLDGEAEVRVEDDGVFRHRIPIPQMGGRIGFGIPLMMALADQVAIQTGTEEQPGTMVRLVKTR